MIVFNNYFKIVKQHIGIIIMFTSIAIGISIANTSYSSEEDFVSVVPKLGIINYDESNLSNDFTKYIEENVESVEIEDSEKDIQDSLYTNKVDAILIVPDNFAAELLSGKNPDVKIKKSAQNNSEYVELLINRYFKIAEVYSKTGMTENDIIENVNKDVRNEIEVKISGDQKSNLQKLAVYYSFENYAFLSIFIFVIGTIMCIFNNEHIKKRNNISKMKQKSFSNQLFLGHLVLTLTIWAIFVIASIIIYKDLMFTMNALLLVINSLCFALTTTSLAYLIGCLIKKQNVISGVQNVVSIGLSFISGCFVPAEWLAPNIVNFAKIFPSYWFIQGNYDIVNLSKFDFETIKPIILNYAIILAFGIVYFIISNVINRKKVN